MRSARRAARAITTCSWTYRPIRLTGGRRAMMCRTPAAVLQGGPPPTVRSRISSGRASGRNRHMSRVTRPMPASPTRSIGSRTFNIGPKYPGTVETVLTAIVLNWHTPELTERAVRRLIDDGVAPERIVIVENGSGDGSAERLRDALPSCRMLALESNVGFARGSNLGADSLPADAYLLVNSDAFVARPGSVAKLATALDDPAVGLAVPKLLNEDLTLQ